MRSEQEIRQALSDLERLQKIACPAAEGAFGPLPDTLRWVLGEENILAVKLTEVRHLLAASASHSN